MALSGASLTDGNIILKYPVSDIPETKIYDPVIYYLYAYYNILHYTLFSFSHFTYPRALHVCSFNKVPRVIRVTEMLCPGNASIFHGQFRDPKPFS